MTSTRRPARGEGGLPPRRHISRQGSHSEPRAPVQQSLITRRLWTDRRLADIRFGVWGPRWRCRSGICRPTYPPTLDL